MRKISYLTSLAALVTALLVLPGVSYSAMWVGGQLGGNFLANSDAKIDVGNVPTITSRDRSARATVIGGVTLGYDFVKEGFGGYNYPDWMRYFSFAVDFTFNRMIFPQQTIVREQAGRTSQFAFPKVEGTMSVLSFLFIGHYGFLPDSEVPNGRLHPYIGVGPGIVFSSIDSGDFGLASTSSTNIALVAETGLRFFCLKNVSLDAAFRYRFFSPTFSHTVGGVTTDVNFDVNSFAFLFRANYHF